MNNNKEKNLLQVNNTTSTPPTLIVKNDSNKSLTTTGSQVTTDQARKKIILGRGYSLMDWIRFTKESVDLAGNKGILRQINYEELAKHNKEDDCWMAIYDKVYNVTPYMKFHPGGVDELMKGAGKNATDLFNQVHQWVNIQSMLEKCLVGNLVGHPPATSNNESKETKSIKSEKSSDSLNEPLKSKLKETSSISSSSSTSTEIPVLDSYQSIQSCNIVLYTKCKNLKNDCLVIDKSNDLNNPNFITLFLYTPISVYKYNLEIPAPTQDDYEIKISKDGKIELILYKLEKIHWWQMCPKLKFQAEIIQNVKTGVNYRECELIKRIDVTHDTNVYLFDLPHSSRMHVPIGHHVFLRLPENQILSKPYTVISESLLPNKILEDGRQICLMIKHYENGELTSQFKNLEIGSIVEISNYTGSFQFESLLNCTDLYLICAGTGLTPMTRILTSSLELDNIFKIKMLFFNKTPKDILWKDELEEIEKKYPKFKLYNILSQANPSWKGRKGRISIDLINELINKNIEKPLFCICGPKQFTDLAIQLLNKHGYSNNFITPFLS